MLARPLTVLATARISIVATALALASAACDKGASPPPREQAAPAAAAPTGTPSVVIGQAQPRLLETDAGAAGTAGSPAPANANADAGSGAAAAAPTAPTAAASTGSLTGVIKLTGAPPAMPLLDRSRDPNCPQTELRAGRVIVGGSGGLASAVVHLAVGSTKGMAVKPRAAVVDQKDCVYRPLVVGITAGQKVRVKNSDPTTHNVRGVKGDENLFNELHLAAAPDKLLPVDAPAGTAVQLKCDVHPWMETWVRVHDSHLFDVTSTDGRFDLADVPAGSYELVVWHPYLGEKKLKVTVEAGKATTVDVPAFAAADYKAED